ncbi:MAG: hypothetical protein O6946_01010 [Gammaproteobacteria bacterium]|nr:hypothetical protein [Gammaproteobacteria bacterium]
MSWGKKAVLLVVGLGVGHVSFPQSFSEPEFEFDQSLFSYAGDKEVARPQFAEPSIIFTCWVILPADAEQMFRPVSGYVQGWWDQMLDDGPAGFLAGAGTKAAVEQWVSRREPRAMYLNAQYRFFPHGTETRLEVTVTVSGLDRKWMPGLEEMMDDFLQTRLVPYVEDIHEQKTAAAANFPGT